MTKVHSLQAPVIIAVKRGIRAHRARRKTNLKVVVEVEDVEGVMMDEAEVDEVADVAAVAVAITPKRINSRLNPVSLIPA